MSIFYSGPMALRRLRAAIAAKLATAAVVGLGASAVVAVAVAVAGGSAQAATSNALVSGVTSPYNGVWLESGDGGHLWDASDNGLCRVDAGTGGTGFTENIGTCDVQAKAPTQATAGPQNANGTYFVYAADMSSKSAGPVRLTYDPTADSGRGAIVAGSGLLVGGLNTVGFYSDAGGSFRVSSIALGPCDHSPGALTANQPNCSALYLAFERSKKIERINNVDKDPGQQSIETISKTTDPRKGVRFGIGMVHNASGTDDLYIDELGGNGVSLITDVATCPPSEGSADPSVVNPPVNQAGGCAASVFGAITTNFPQGIAVQNDADGNGRFLYVADSPTDGQASVLRYNFASGQQDVVSSAVSPYDSLLNPGQSVSSYTVILGLVINPHNGDLFIGDDPTAAVLVNPPLAKGHIFTIPGTNGVAPADCNGTAAVPCTLPPPPSTVTPSLYAYGLTAPKGGVTLIPSDDGGHLWAADHSQGLCRMDVVTAAPGLHAYNPASCDDGTVLGSGGQTVYDPAIVTGTADLHYVYVAQNDHLSPGVIRFSFDPSADNGAGALVAGSAVIMAPGAGLDGDKANGLALGPCKPGSPATCTSSLYMGGLLDGFIRRINNPQDDPRLQTVDVVAMTTEQRAGTLGKGINGSMGMIGDDLYLPENQGFTIVKNVSQCPAAGQVCATTPLNIGTFGTSFGSAIGVDANPLHSAAGLVYAAVSPGAANATIYQYDVATNTSRIYASQGQMPAAGSAEATVWCTTTCTHAADPADPPGGKASFRFAQGIMVDPGGNVYLTEDALAGARGGRGHAWVAPFVAWDRAGVTPVPLPGGTAPPPGTHSCSVTLDVPSLAGGQTYWLQFTAHAAGQLAVTWTTPVPQSTQLLLYPGNPFAGSPDPVNTGPKGGSIASAANTTGTTLSLSTAPASQPAGTYTAQFLNGGPAFPASTATLSYNNDAATACPAPPTTVPGVAGNLTATAANAAASLTWSAPLSDGGSPITGYTITTVDPTGATPATSTTTASPVTSATVTGLTNGRPYQFQVAARNAVGTGAPSALSNAVTPAAPGVTVPGVPVIGGATAGNAAANLAWTAPAVDGGSPITGYTITAVDPTGATPATSTTTTGIATSATVTGLSNGRPYQFQVAAANAAGTGAPSSLSNTVIPKAPLTAPGAPRIGAASARVRAVSVSWTAPVNTGGSPITSYTVTAVRAATGALSTVSVVASARSAVVTGLLNGVSYRLRVSARSTVGLGPASALSNAVITPTVPAAARITTARAGVSTDGAVVSATANWAAPLATGGSAITGYRVSAYRFSGARVVSSKVWARTLPPATRTLKFSGLVSRGTYRFKVQAINAVGIGAASAYSNLVTAR
jgi:hypothetical protein